MKRRVLVLAGLVVLGGIGVGAYFGPDQYRVYKAKEAVKLLLRDPDSAVFPKVKVGEQAICGLVNSKNGYGAMAGAIGFVVRDGAAAALEPTELFHDDEEIKRGRERLNGPERLGSDYGAAAIDDYFKLLREQEQYLQWWLDADKACLTSDELRAEAAKPASATAAPVKP